MNGNIIPGSEKIASSMKIGILVHGRHLKAKDWQKLEWGETPYKLGTLPMMVLVLLNTGIENIDGIVFGTGGSEKDGLKEAEYTKRFLLEHIGELSNFELIKNHPCFQSSLDLESIKKLFQNIICETDSQNTEEEVINAAKIFSELGVREVKQVTCGSHAPRCQLVQLKVRSAGGIPRGQLWSCYGDDMAFAGSVVKDVVVMEPPHRGDDPMVSADIQAHQVFPLFYKIPTVERKIEALKAIKEVLEKS
jgi:hypothetical protein